MATSVRLSERQELCSAKVTLDGARAKVTGYRLPFAHVTDVATGVSDEWSWETVRLIVAKGGHFKR